MATIRTSYEAARGCGYRKKGGLYLVGGELSRPCGKLPIPLHVCPTCGGGVKPTRAWQWIRPRLLFSGAKCRHEGEAIIKQGAPTECSECIVGGAMPDRGGLVWIGGSYYATPQDFIAEAAVMGVSRRIPSVPKGFEPGRTVVYLAHRQVPTLGVPPGSRAGFGDDDDAEVPLQVMKGPAVFSAFVPRFVEYIVKGDETEEQLDRLEARGIKLVDVKPQQLEMVVGS